MKRFTGELDYNDRSFDSLIGIRWRTKKGKVNFIYIGQAIDLGHRQGQLMLDLTRKRKHRNRHKKLRIWK